MVINGVIIPWMGLELAWVTFQSISVVSRRWSPSNEPSISQDPYVAELPWVIESSPFIYPHGISRCLNARSSLYFRNHSSWFPSFCCWDHLKMWRFTWGIPSTVMIWRGYPYWHGWFEGTLMGSRFHHIRIPMSWQSSEALVQSCWTPSW